MSDKLIGRFLVTFKINKNNKEEYVDLAIQFNGTNQFLPATALDFLFEKIGFCSKYIIHVSAIPNINCEWEKMIKKVDHWCIVDI